MQQQPSSFSRVAQKGRHSLAPEVRSLGDEDDDDSIRVGGYVEDSVPHHRGGVFRSSGIFSNRLIWIACGIIFVGLFLWIRFSGSASVSSSPPPEDDELPPSAAAVDTSRSHFQDVSSKLSLLEQTASQLESRMKEIDQTLEHLSKERPSHGSLRTNGSQKPNTREESTSSSRALSNSSVYSAFPKVVPLRDPLVAPHIVILAVAVIQEGLTLSSQSSISSLSTAPNAYYEKVQLEMSALNRLVGSVHQQNYGVRIAVFHAGLPPSTVAEIRSWKFVDVFSLIEIFTGDPKDPSRYDRVSTDMWIFPALREAMTAYGPSPNHWDRINLDRSQNSIFPDSSPILYVNHSEVSLVGSLHSVADLIRSQGLFLHRGSSSVDGTCSRSTMGVIAGSKFDLDVVETMISCTHRSCPGTIFQDSIASSKLLTDSAYEENSRIAANLFEIHASSTKAPDPRGTVLSDNSPVPPFCFIQYRTDMSLIGTRGLHTVSPPPATVISGQKDTSFSGLTILLPVGLCTCLHAPDSDFERETSDILGTLLPSFFGEGFESSPHSSSPSKISLLIGVPRGHRYWDADSSRAAIALRDQIRTKYAHQFSSVDIVRHISPKYWRLFSHGVLAAHAVHDGARYLLSVFPDTKFESVGSSSPLSLLLQAIPHLFPDPMKQPFVQPLPSISVGSGHFLADSVLLSAAHILAVGYVAPDIWRASGLDYFGVLYGKQRKVVELESNLSISLPRAGRLDNSNGEHHGMSSGFTDECENLVKDSNGRILIAEALGFDRYRIEHFSRHL